MNKKLRAFLEANGLRADATEQEAWAKYDQMIADGISIPGIDPGQRAAVDPPAPQPAPAPVAPTPEPQGARTFTQADVEVEIARAMKANSARRNAITDRLRVAGLDTTDQFARTMLDDPKVSMERASMLIMDELQKRQIPIGTGSHVGREAGEKFRDAAIDGLCLRSGIRIEKPAEGARQFRSMTIIDIIREDMELNGVNTRGMDRVQLATRALSPMSTSDFANIFAAVANKNLLNAYGEAPATWQPFVGMMTANDFKSIYAIKLSGSPDLQTIGEDGEYKTAKFSDSAENYRVSTKGIRVPLSRNMIINDDMRAFTRVPQLFGAAARRGEADMVYSLITANAYMSDGYALFSTSHANLAGTGTAISSDSLSAGRTKMRGQKGLNGERLDIRPAFILVPTILETTAEILLRSAALPTAQMSGGVYNPWSGALTPIADPRLDENSTTAWYLLASPSQAPVIEVAHLAGYETPYVEEQVDFASDALMIKVRHDFGCGVVDYVGAYKNAGA